MPSVSPPLMTRHLPMEVTAVTAQIVRMVHGMAHVRGHAPMVAHVMPSHSRMMAHTTRSPPPVTCISEDGCCSPRHHLRHPMGRWCRTCRTLRRKVVTMRSKMRDMQATEPPVAVAGIACKPRLPHPSALRHVAAVRPLAATYPPHHRTRPQGGLVSRGAPSRPWRPTSRGPSMTPRPPQPQTRLRGSMRGRCTSPRRCRTCLPVDPSASSRRRRPPCHRRVDRENDVETADGTGRRVE